MANVLFKRVEDSTQLDNIPVVDGSFYVTGDGKSFIDYNGERLPVGGTPDTEMSDRSRNTVENKVIKEYVDNSIISRKVIYENLQGTDLDLVCSETISNFDYLQFDFMHQDYHSSMIVPIIDNNVQIYSIGIPSGNTTMQLLVQRYTINGNTLQYVIEGMANINNKTISWQSFDTNLTTLKVKRVIGIKK